MLPNAANRHDFNVFGTMALGSFACGGLLTAYDWDMVPGVSLVPLVLAVLALTLTRLAKAGVGASASGAQGSVGG